MANTPQYGGFNPQVPPTQDPNYLNYSRVVDAPPADKTAGMAISAVGDAITGVVGLADSVVKGVLDDKVRISVEGHRDAQTQALERIRREQQNGTIPTGSPAGDLTSTEDGVETAPEALDSSISRAENLGSARSQGAVRVNDTYYTMQLNSIAKQLRAQYPGYRDYIDEKFSKIAGMDPANAYYKNLMQDINTRTKAADTAESRALKVGYANITSVPELTPYIRAVEANVPGAADKLMIYVNGWHADKATFDAKQRARTLRNDQQTDQADEVRTDFNKEFAGTVDKIVNTPFAMTGMNEPVTMQRLMSDHASGNLALQPEQWDQLLVNMNNRKTQLISYGKTLYDSRDYATKWKNPKQANEDVQQNLVVVDALIDSIKNKDVGTMFEIQRRIQGRKDQAEMGVLSSDLGKWLLVSNAIKNSAGDILNNELNRQILTSDVLPKYRSALGDMLKRSMVPDDVRKDGVVKSLYNDVETLQKAGVGSETKVYDRLFDNLNNLNNPKVPLKEKQEIIDYMFKDKNRFLMDKFKSDYVDPQGRRIPGRESLFVRLSSEDVTKAVVEAAKNKPQLLTKYKDTLEQQFKTIYQEKLLEMNKYTDPRMKIGWNPDTRQFVVEAAPNPRTGIARGVYSGNYQVPEAVERNIRSLNWGLANMAKMHDKVGSDTSAYLVNAMMQLGYRPGENTTGLPQQIMDNIANSKKSFKTRFEESYK